MSGGEAPCDHRKKFSARLRPVGVARGAGVSGRVFLRRPSGGSCVNKRARRKPPRRPIRGTGSISAATSDLQAGNQTGRVRTFGTRAGSRSRSTRSRRQGASSGVFRADTICCCRRACCSDSRAISPSRPFLTFLGNPRALRRISTRCRSGPRPTWTPCRPRCRCAAASVMFSTTTGCSTPPAAPPGPATRRRSRRP